MTHLHFLIPAFVAPILMASAAAGVLAPSSAIAQQQAPAATVPTWPIASLRGETGPRRFVTAHSGVFGAKTVAYRATVAETIVKDRQGRPGASVFTIAYTADGVADRSKRPVIFLYNGGPGGGSTFLHLGAFGPKRMESLSTAAQADPATPLIDNAYSILDVADLVFLDPPDTGFSRTLPGVDPQTFRTSAADSAACVQTIVHWLEANGRIGAPVYLVGESFGTHRNILVSRDLRLARPAVDVAGMVMVSGPVPATRGTNPAPLDAVNRVIDVAPWAWYHGRIDNCIQSLAQAVAKARTFAHRDYVEALLLGNRLDEAGRARIAARLQEVTGLPAAYYLENGLVIRSPTRDLLKDQGQALTLFDVRDVEDAATVPDDKSRDWDAMFRGLEANITRYARDTLRVGDLGPYYNLAPAQSTGVGPMCRSQSSKRCLPARCTNTRRCACSSASASMTARLRWVRTNMPSRTWGTGDRPP